MTIGFVGIGNIGLPMCQQLLRAGEMVRAYDVAPQALERAAETGAEPADDLEEVASAADVIFTCLPSPASVADVVRGLLKHARPGTIIVDLSTNDPELVAILEQEAAERAVAFLDSPVAGGVPGAKAGTLTLMVGGDATAFAKVQPLLQHLGSNIFHLGPIGAGSVTKLINNYLCFCHLSAAAEAFLAAQRSGVDPAQLLRVLQVGSGSSAALERYERKILTGNFEAEFTVDLAYKDLRLALAIGERTNVPMRYASMVKVGLQEARASGLGSLDVCAVVRVIEDVTGDEVRQAAAPVSA